MTLYLLDANVFIHANRDYYPIDRVPEYWAWLAYHAEAGTLKVPKPVWEELTPHDESLKAWLNAHKEIFLLDPDESDTLVPNVLALYGVRLTDVEIERIGQDPFLIAAASFYGGVVVSKETSNPRKERAGRKIPDVCRDLGVQCITDHKLIVSLDFKTAWRR